MNASTTTNRSLSIIRSTPWLAIVSGCVGIYSFSCLLIYIMSPSLQMQDSGAMSPTGRLLLTIHFLSSMAQALLMIPVTLWLHRSAELQSSALSRSTMFLGISALGGVALLRLMALVDHSVSDILFMIPMGLVGFWLALVNWEGAQRLPRWMRILGGIAGICLVGVGLNFFLNGGLVVFSNGPMAYGNDVNFHIGLGLSGLPGFTLFPVWCILLGFRPVRPKT